MKKVEKWNYSCVFEGIISQKTFDKFSKNKIEKVYPVNSLPLTDFEQKLIHGLNQANNNLLKNLDLLPIAIDPKQIIVLKKDDFHKHVESSPAIAGKYSFGYIYLPRENKVDFTRYLAHEMTHAFSYCEVLVSENIKKKERCISLNKLGISEINKFEGINEALTEIWSKKILKEFFLLFPEYKEELEESLHKTAYFYHVRLVKELANELGNSLIDPNSLFKAYFTGEPLKDLIQEENYGLFYKLSQIKDDKKSLFKWTKKIGGKNLLKKVKE